jgi:hypothetical protein
MEAQIINENSLSIVIPSAKNLTLENARRLTGPGLLWKYPGAALDVFFMILMKST